MKGEARLAKVRELLPDIMQHVGKYTKSSNWEACKAILVTYFYRLIAIMLYYYQFTIIAVILDALSSVRTFIVFHECCHGSLFATPQYNKFFCHLLSMDIVTPANYWKNNHLKHHSILGNNEVYDIANTIPYSKKQFQELPASKKLLFRIVRQPIIFFTIFPLLQWWFEYPVFEGNPLIWIGHIIKFAMMYYLSPYIFIAYYLGTIIGLSLFHLQHGANESFRTNSSSFSKDECAILGSTYIPIPWPISIFSLGIEFHHIHHLNTRVPFYSLRKCHFDGEHFWKGIVTNITFSNFWESMNTVLWDDDVQKLVAF
jgi:omega-6 fatty acid desaturase (delta-12 desaturase)